MKKICVIGLGKMGKAILDGLHSAGYDVFGCGRGDKYEVCNEASIIIIAVKPQQFKELKLNFSGKLVISIMAGVSVEKLRENWGEKNDYVRWMPNMGIKAGMSATGWYAEEPVKEKFGNEIQVLLGQFGEGYFLKDEDMIDAFTAVAGCGPAYYFRFTEALAKAGMELGLDREISEKIARQTFVGAAGMVSMDEVTGLDEMVNQVASKGGTTEAALKNMDEESFDRIVTESVKKAYLRAKELNN